MSKISKIYENIIEKNENLDDKLHLFFNLLLISGLEEVAESRFTTVFIMKMFHAFIKGANIDRIIYEIKNLEDPNENHSRTKPETQFTGTHLQGLWHKHYENAGLKDMAINISEQLKHSKTFDIEAFEIIKNINLSDQQKASMLGYLAFGKQYLDRIKDGRLTGDWIVYHIHKGKNYYLNINIGNHTGDDENIAREIKGATVYEFPFLKGDLPIFS
jgi:hypothetical protein